MIRILVVALVLMCARNDVSAQQLQPRPVPPMAPHELIESFTYQSGSMGVQYALNVAIPKEHKPGDGKKYPALIVTDGDWAFPGVNVALRSVEGAIEPIFLISVGTPVEDGMQAFVRRRVYEFSPPGWDRQDTFGEVVTKVCQDYQSPEDRCTGGAPAFLHAIVSELVPLVAAKYPIDTSRLGLFGHSAGGFFAAWAVFQPGSLFRKYLISSPAMAYGDGAILREEERYASEHKDLPVSLYLGAGALELGEPLFEVSQILSGMSLLAGRLGSRKYPGLGLVTEYHPGMGHDDVMGTTVVRGLRILYGKQ